MARSREVAREKRADGRTDGRVPPLDLPAATVAGYEITGKTLNLSRPSQYERHP